MVFGRSLGGAVGAVLARNNPDKVILLVQPENHSSLLFCLHLSSFSQVRDFANSIQVVLFYV